MRNNPSEFNVASTDSKFRNILASHAVRQDAKHRDLTKLHREGGRYIRTIYLKDGTMLSDIGGSKLIQHPDNRLAVVFNDNPDKVRSVTLRTSEDGSLEQLKHPGLASTDGLIIISARECDSYGLPKSWVSESVIKHNALVSFSNSLHGILKRTGESEWRSESLSYDITPPKQKRGEDVDETKMNLSCGYGVGIKANTVNDDETFQKRLWRWHKNLNRTRVLVDKDDIYPMVQNHFSVIGPKVLQGFNPRSKTFTKGFETKFSEAVKKKNAAKGLVRRATNYVLLKTALVTSGALGAAFLLLSGIASTFKGKAIGNLIRSVPGVLWQLLSRRAFALIPAATIAVAAFTIYFLSNTIANANSKQQQIWLLKNADNKSNSFYASQKDPDVMARRYQEADPKQMAEARTISVEDYGFVPSDVEVYDEEPEFYSLNRLFSTKSVREGSLMEAFSLNAHKISYYDESKGIQRVVIPDLKTAFVTFSHSSENDIEMSSRQRAILDEGEVIKIVENPNTGELEKTAMSYSAFEADLLKITQEFANHSLLTDPRHDDYMREKAEEAERNKIINRLKTRIGSSLGFRYPEHHA